jgi:flagellar hook-length control protein FliK
VDFQADLAPTRQALESSLPALAGALQEAGLTLAGGGVFQQSPGQQGQDSQQARAGQSGASGSSRRRDEADDGQPLPALGSVTAARPRGIVDLVA